MDPYYMEKASYSWVKSMVDTLLAAGLISSSISALLAGASSTLVTYTKTQFLAIESLHMVIAAGLLGGIAGWYIRAIPGDIFSLISMAMLTLLVAYMIEKGYSQDASIGFGVVVASIVASASSYYIALGVPGGVSYIYTLLFGNPFLFSISGATYYMVLGFSILAIMITLWKRFIYMAFDPEFFELVKGGSRIYRWILYTLIATTAIYISKLIGAIPAHILLLIPGMAAQSMGSSSYIPGILLALSSSLLAILLSYSSGLPYGLSLGAISISLYIGIYIGIRLGAWKHG
jgi:ABC-type Mn2+/Zn2+ transport system permease subunit